MYYVLSNPNPDATSTCIGSQTAIGFQTKNYAAIDRAPGAGSKSDEFFVWNPLVIEIVSLLCLKPPKRCCTFWGPESLCAANFAPRRRGGAPGALSVQTPGFSPKLRNVVWAPLEVL